MKQNPVLIQWLSIIAVSCFLLSSCVYGPLVSDPYIVDTDRQKENLYYVPAASNVPLLTEKNDLSFSVMRASGSKFSGGEIQAAVLPWKHAGIIAGYSFGTKDDNAGIDYMTGAVYMKYNRFEIGPGYVAKLAKGWHFESYAGIGTGKIRNSHHSGSSELKLNHIFLQPTIAISDKKQRVQFAISSRLSGVKFNVQDTLFDTDREPFSSNHLKSLYDQPFHVMWEPALVFRGGWKNVLFNVQYSFSADLTNPDLYRAKNNFSMGVSLRVNTGKVVSSRK